MENKLEELHKLSMEILSEVGFKIEDEEILEKVKDEGIKVENSRIFFTEEEIYKYINKAPKEFTIHARNAKYNMNINVNNIEYVPGYGAAQIRELDGKIRNALLEDNIKFTKLVHVSDIFNINGGILAQPNDVDAKLSSEVMIYTAIKKSDKCILGLTAEEKSFRNIMNMLSILFGSEEELKQKPRIISLVNTLSPLALSYESIETLKISCEYNQPLVLAGGGIGGATAPITLAGNIAMSNAESLALIAICQIIKPHHPVVYACLGSTMDIKTGGIAKGGAEHAKFIKYGAKLAKKYNLPCRCGGTQSDAQGVTIQAGFDSVMNMMASHDGVANFIIHSAGILDGYTCMSYEKFIADLHVIENIESYSRELEINKKTGAVDVIKEVVANNSSFMSHKHTAKWCRKEVFVPKIVHRNKQALGDTPNEVIYKLINDEINKMLSLYNTPTLDENIGDKLRSFMEEIGVEKHILDTIER